MTILLISFTRSFNDCVRSMIIIDVLHWLVQWFSIVEFLLSSIRRFRIVQWFSLIYFFHSSVHWSRSFDRSTVPGYHRERPFDNGRLRLVRGRSVRGKPGVFVCVHDLGMHLSVTWVVMFMFVPPRSMYACVHDLDMCVPMVLSMCIVHDLCMFVHVCVHDLIICVGLCSWFGYMSMMSYVCPLFILVCLPQYMCACPCYVYVCQWIRDLCMCVHAFTMYDMSMDCACICVWFPWPPRALPHTPPAV